MVSVCLRVTLLYLTSCAAKHLPALTEDSYDDEIVSPLDGDVAAFIKFCSPDGTLRGIDHAL